MLLKVPIGNVDTLKFWNARAFKRPFIQFERPRMRARLNDHVCARAFIYLALALALALGTPCTTCGTNYELEDNAECTYSGTRELACNTCV